MAFGLPSPGAEFGFRHHYVDRELPGSSWGQTAVADLDRDGRPDFITGRSRGEILWYRMETPDRWMRQRLGEQSPSDVGGAALDVDGDGWADFVAGGAWYRNTGRPRSEPFERIVFDPHLNGVHDVVVADVDGDKRPDALTMSDKNNLRWYRIPSDPRQSWQRHDVGPSVHAGLAVGDLDGDGDLDVVRSNMWFENADRKGTRWTIRENIPFGNPRQPYPLARYCVVADVDRDGDMDLVMTENEIKGGRIAWLENAEDRGRAWKRHELLPGDSVPRGAYHSLVVADFDNDGDPDVFTCEMEGIPGDRPPRWFIWENVDGKGQKFIERVILDAKLGGHAAVAADFDGDGDVDIVSKLWRPRNDNANGGKNHVDFLENLLKSPEPVQRPQTTKSRPNILLIVADDLGWADLGCYGADLHETPHLDRIAREGVRFTDAYAPAPVCTPTRAALLTGQAPARLHMTIWSEGSLNPPKNRKLLEAPSRHDLPHTETTLAKHLQTAGYLTALVGKWHLGDANHAPEAHGFDVNIGGTHWGAPQSFFWPYRGSGQFGGEFRYVPHLEFGQPGEYLTDRLTAEALRVLDHAKDRPFFLYLAHHAPHTPIEAKPADVAHFQTKRRPGLRHQHPGYGAMLRSLDESVGRVLARLEELGLAGNTIVVFASDNGGYIGVDSKTGLPVTNNAPLRSGKGSLYEGGLRVPLLVRWPGVTSPGAICREPVLLTDLFYTLLEAADLSVPPGLKSDGLSLVPVLRSPSAALPRESLFFHYPHHYHAPRTSPMSAIRSGDWKLIESFEDRHVELYDLKADLGEQIDLAQSEPALAKRLRQRLDEWRLQVGAALPTTNPGYSVRMKPSPTR